MLRFTSAPLKNFDGSLKSINDWMMLATKELEDIKNSSDKMAPEDRVARTMDLQEDIAAKFEIIKANTAAELELLPQGKCNFNNNDAFQTIFSKLVGIPSI